MLLILRTVSWHTAILKGSILLVFLSFHAGIGYLGPKMPFQWLCYLEYSHRSGKMPANEAVIVQLPRRKVQNVDLHFQIYINSLLDYIAIRKSVRGQCPGIVVGYTSTCTHVEDSEAPVAPDFGFSQLFCYQRRNAASIKCSKFQERLSF